MRTTGLRTVHLGLQLAVVAALASCGDGGGGRVGGGPDLDVRGQWVFVSGTAPDGDLVAPARELPTLTFDADRAGGHTGCNSYGGEVEQSGDALSFGEIDMTFTACAGSVGAFEGIYLSALGEVDSAARDGDGLVLTGEAVSLRFEPMPAWPEQAVVGRTWRLHQLTTDPPGSDPIPAAAHVDRSADHAMLYLSDGRVTGSTGCRSFTGRWTEHDGVVTLTEAAYTGSCLPDPPVQTVWVEHVISTFTATTRFRDGAEELVLTAVRADPDGTRRQLVYRR